ncbi:hypothetical protein B484DRAFT_394037, partial [Ochromonadaceae sp. CCMP2298]
MSLSSVINKYPVAAGELLETMALLTAMPVTHSNNQWTVVESAELAENEVFVLPLLDVALPLPSSAELLDCNQLWLRLKGKNRMSQAAGDTTHELVCEIVGGAGLAGDKLGVSQTGVTFAHVQCVLVPCAWVLLDAKAAGLFKVTAAPGATAGNLASPDNPAMARGRDLDGNTWGCLDKRGAQIRLNAVIALLRLFSANKMKIFVDDILFDEKRMKQACMAVKSSGGQPREAEHEYAGLHLYPSIHALAVMRGGFGKDSKFQHALLLHYNCMDLTEIALEDFLTPKVANAALFERGRCTTDARLHIRTALEYASIFYTTFCHADFQDSLLPLTRSLQLDSQLWDQFDDAYLHFRCGKMLEVFSEEVCRQEKSTIAPLISLTTAAGCAGMLKVLAIKTVGDAREGGDNWTKNGHTFFYARDVGQHWEVVPRPRTDDVGLPLPTAPKRTSDGNPKADPTTDPSGGAGGKQGLTAKQELAAKQEQVAAARAKQHCAHHLMHLLTVVDGAGKTAACTQAAGKCPYRHVPDLTSVTKAQASQLSRLSFKDKVLAGNFGKAVAARAEGSWKAPEPTCAPPVQPVPPADPNPRDLAPAGFGGSGGGKTAVHNPVSGSKLLAVECEIPPEPPPHTQCSPDLLRPPRSGMSPLLLQQRGMAAVQEGAVGVGDESESEGDSDEESFIPPKDACVLEALLVAMGVLFPAARSAASHRSALMVAERAYKANHFDSNLSAAIAAVEEFSFDPAALARDAREFGECGGNLSELARRRLDTRRPQRLNVARVESCISEDNPQRDLLLHFATQGVDMRPLLPPEFVPNGPVRAAWPRQAGTYAKAPRVVNSLLSKAFHKKGLAVILPTASIGSFEGCNVSTSGWAPKSGANNGRPTFNPKLLNVPRTKINADVAWGAVHHPNAQSIVELIVGYYAK